MCSEYRSPLEEKLAAAEARKSKEADPGQAERFNKLSEADRTAWGFTEDSVEAQRQSDTRKAGGLLGILKSLFSGSKK